MAAGVEFTKNLFGFGTNAFTSPMVIRTWQQYRYFYLGALLCSTPVFRTVGDRLARRSPPLAAAMEWITVPVYAFLLLWSVSYIMMGSHNPFIYFNF